MCSKPSLNVSRYLPSYLKLDLNVGMADEHPFISALDETMQRICAAAQAEAFSMTRSHFPIERKKAMLEGSGFDLSSLGNTEIEKLYSITDSLFRRQGTLSNVSDLGAIYFDNSVTQIRRGRPLDRKTMTHKMSFPMTVSDRDGIDRSIFISLNREVSRASKEAFIRSLRALIPHGYEVIFQEPSSSERSGEIRFDVTTPSRLTSWRL